MSWNYRIIVTPSKLKLYHEYSIHEVYYSPDGNINVWSENSISPAGNNPAELKADLEYMLRAFDKPFLEEIDNKLVEKLP